MINYKKNNYVISLIDYW